MANDHKEATRALNGWARSQGYSDFDLYMQAGGSIGEAVSNLNQRRMRLDLAIAALYEWTAPPPAPEPPELHPEIVTEHELLDDHERANARMTIGPDALARAEAEVIGDPVDPHNAQVQGAEDEG